MQFLRCIGHISHARQDKQLAAMVSGSTEFRTLLSPLNVLLDRADTDNQHSDPRPSSPFSEQTPSETSS